MCMIWCVGIVNGGWEDGRGLEEDVPYCFVFIVIFMLESLFVIIWVLVGFIFRIAMILRVEISLRNLQNYCENCW